MRHAAAVMFATVIVVVAGGAAAQTTTGRLIGTTVDESGAVLPGVTVTISSPALIGGVQSRVTDDQGEFNFVGIAPGEYTVKAERTGWIPQERAMVKVSLGHAVSLTLAMPKGIFSGEIDVIDETPVIDPTQVNTGQIFDHAYLQNSTIGSVNRDYLVVVNQTAGVTGGAWFDVPQSRVFGSTIGENAYFIDGVDTTDPFTATATVTMNFDAIGEIQFQTGGFEAEYGRATGGIINLVTRSGGNRFTGTLDVRKRDDSFQESGGFFDSGEFSSDYQNVSATLGGPIARDRAWFFTSYQRIDDEFTPVGAPTTRMATGHNYLAKVTWQIDTGWRLTGKYSSDPRSREYDGSSQWTMPEATSHLDGGSTVLSGELSSVLSDSLIWTSVVGAYNLDANIYPQSGDLSAISHYNLNTGLTTVNYADQQYLESNRNDFTTDISWFVDDLAGSHEFKGGIEYSKVSYNGAVCLTGTPDGERCVADGVGFSFEDIEDERGEPLPFRMLEVHTSGPTTVDGAVATAFFQDAWRPGRNVTLKIGLRYDTVTYDTTNGTQIADMSMVQPRLGVAWDVSGNAKNLLRGSWGRFMHPNALTLPWWVRPLVEPQFRWYSCSGFLPLQFGIAVGSTDECAAVAAAYGSVHRTDNAGWDPFGWVLGEIYASEPSQTAAGLRATYADELILGFEREVGNRASIELTFVDKKTRDMVEDTCNGNWPTPAAGAACDYFVLGNISSLKRDYRGFVVKYESRAFDWLTLLASYTFSTSKGSVEYTQNAGIDADIYPWHFDNRYGYLSDHRANRFKLNGFFNIKGDWTIGFDGWWASPFTWQPYEDSSDNLDIDYGEHFLEPRGSREANTNYQLDLQLTKGFTIGSTRLLLIGSALNVFSSEQPTAVCAHISGCGSYEMGDPIEWQVPRRYEVGLRLEF